MANKKINELDSRASLSLSDLMAVGDPSTGYLYKTTISDLKTLTGAGVVSFNGRFGSVVPAEGDYSLTQLSDVIITSASNNQVLRYNGSNWVNATIDLSGYVPYTGATGNVNLGSNTLLAAQIKATSSAGLSINANSGTQIADLGAGGGANMTLFGGLTGTSASFSSSVTGNTIVKTGGTSSQFLKADGSVDSSTYLTTSSAASTYVPYTGATTNVNIGSNLFSSSSIQLNGDNTSNFGYLAFKQFSGGNSGANGYTSIYGQSTNYLGISFSQGSGNVKTALFSSDSIALNTALIYNLPASSGTLALTSNLSSYLPLAGGTLTGTLNGTSAVFSSTVQASAYRLTGMTAGAGALYWSSDRVTLANYNATGKVVIEANGGTTVATFGGATYNSDFVGTGRFTGDLYAETGIFSLGLFTSDETKSLVPGGVSSLTTLYVSGDLIIDTNTLYVDSANNRVGIGTTSPQSRLHISGGYTGFQHNSAGAYPAYNTYFGAIGTNFSNANSELDIWNTVGGGFVFRKQTGASAQTALMTITNAGNVGIGTSSPEVMLQIGANDSTIKVFSVRYSSVPLYINGSFDGSAALSTFSTNNYNTSNNSSSWSGFSNTNFGSSAVQLAATTAGAEIRFLASSAVNTNPTERAKITSSGISARLAVTIFGSSGAYGSGDNPFLGLGTSSPDTFGAINAPFGDRMKLNAYHGFEFKTSNSGGSPLTMMTISISGETTFAVLGTGTVYSNGGRITNTNPSDINLKENIEDLEYGLNEILQLRPVSYNWKNDKIKQGKQFGFIAQEVQEIMPDLVKDGEYLGLDKEAIFTIVTNAIKELKIEIDNLKVKN
jgi:hypothetical protein